MSRSPHTPRQPAKRFPRPTMVRRRYVLAFAVCLSVFMVGQPARTATIDPSDALVFAEAALQGFGDRQNSLPWSTIWWKGRLYVGTGRATQCVEAATQTLYVPTIPYPPADTEIECTPSPQDLPLQAEIWRWTPATNVWERVYQSPNDVPIPGHPGKLVARDIGFRTMAVLREPNGREALYVGGVSSRPFNPGVPPPRILRTVDGTTFGALPQDRGTFLGDTDAHGFRSLTVHNGKLYVVASNGLIGQGPVYEGVNPAVGNDNWRQITPRDRNYYELASFNGSLYVGSGSRSEPFSVWKVGISSTTPFPLQAVLLDGGYRRIPKATAVVSMQVFQDHLYIGTEQPAEVYRVNADDRWDLVVGTTRRTPTGETKEPLSGEDAGFGWAWNLHIWRMGVHDGRLYLGTFDQSTNYRNSPLFQTPAMKALIGFDLYVSVDGRAFVPISKNGLGDPYSDGVRQLVSTPCGLFLGATNDHYGLRVWKGTPPIIDPPPHLDRPYRVYLPLAAKGGEPCITP